MNQAAYHTLKQIKHFHVDRLSIANYDSRWILAIAPFSELPSLLLKWQGEDMDYIEGRCRSDIWIEHQG